jgi:hypothetical protein
VDRTREAASGEETDALVNARCIVSEVLKSVLKNRSSGRSAGYQRRLGGGAEGEDAENGGGGSSASMLKFEPKKIPQVPNALARAPCPLSPVCASANWITCELVSGTIGTPHPRLKKGQTLLVKSRRAGRLGFVSRCTIK